MRYGTNKKKNTKLEEGLIKFTGKGEPWHTTEEEIDRQLLPDGDWSTSGRVNSCFLYLKESLHLHSTKHSFILHSKYHLFLIMISTTFVLFLTWTLSLKFSIKLLPLVFSLTFCLYSSSSSFQSAYCMFHSTETTLLSIHNDLILAMDCGQVTSLILLDLSAAFDTVNHSILHCLQKLVWSPWHVFILSYFRAVSILNSTSSFSNNTCGIPQSSVLAHFFSLFIQPPWLCHLQELNQPVCWWHPIHLFHSFKYNFFTLNIWDTNYVFSMNPLRDSNTRRWILFSHS